MSVGVHQSRRKVTAKTPKLLHSYLGGNWELGTGSWLIFTPVATSADKSHKPVRTKVTSDNEEYIVRLVGRVVTVSVETVRLIEELAGAVRMEDWMDEVK